MSATDHEIRAREALTDSAFQRVAWVDETGSTNADLLAAAAAGAPAPAVLVAEHQHAGRGRLDRTWEAPAGSSLLVSVLVRPDLAPADAHLAAVAVALAAATACQQVAGIRPDLKWPNDLVVETNAGTRKLGGILAESRIEGGRLDAVVVGIGLNVNWPAELPEELASIAIACNHLTGVDHDRVALLVAMLGALEPRLEQLDDAEGRAHLVREFHDRCSTIGRRVQIVLGEESFEGRAVEITASGHLLVEVAGPDGLEASVEQREVSAGDVVHLRPAT